MRSDSISETAQAQGASGQWRGETIAYAVQSGVYNLAANFVEPYVNYRIQERYSGPDAAHHGPHGNYTQNLVGEFAGDLIGCSTLILAETMTPKQLHAFSLSARRLVDPLYDSLAHVLLTKDRSEPDYEERLERWKTFQERNLVRSTIMATAGIVGNVVTQKLVMGNPSPTSLIFKGKLVSTAITTVVELGARFAFPSHINRLDTWMGKNLFAPLMGAKAMPAGDLSDASHAERLSQPKHEQSLSNVR